jgi:hypothetical protein
MSTAATMWWWIGNAVLAAVIPVVILLLNRVIRPAVEIRKYADDILEHGVGLSGTLDPVPALADTRDLVKQVGEGVSRYGAALDKLL